jgi:hypothetical protein
MVGAVIGAISVAQALISSRKTGRMNPERRVGAPNTDVGGPSLHRCAHAHVKASQALPCCGRSRGRRLYEFTQCSRCGCRAAHANQPPRLHPIISHYGPAYRNRTGMANRFLFQWMRANGGPRSRGKGGISVRKMHPISFRNPGNVLGHSHPDPRRKIDALSLRSGVWSSY